MLKSMTAFARVEASQAWGKIVWEIRSVNHRYLECNIRLPDGFNALEERLRKRIRSRLLRGKVDCSLHYQAEARRPKLQFDPAYTQALLALIKEMNAQSAHPLTLDALELLRWPGVMQFQEDTPLALLEAEIIALFDQAIENMVQERNREGQELSQGLWQRLENIDVEIALIGQCLPAVLQHQRQRLLARFDEAKLQLDPLRLEQEIVLIAQRIDISEELERIESHTKQVRQLLNSQGGIGRQLDFLLQELQREVNTLGAKAIDSVIIQSAIQLKVLIEQMREQVQNIE